MLRTLLGAAVALLLSACSSSDPSNSSGDPGGQGGSNPGTGGAPGTGGGGLSSGSAGGDGGGGAGGGGSSVPNCYTTCVTAADCAQPNASPLLDADNYECNGGRCEYHGCNSTAECTSTYMSPDYVCVAAQGSSFPTCYPTCVTVADCVQPNAPPLLDADNYECNEGRCEWQGCNSTAECAGSGPNQVCAPVPNGSFSTCYTSCTTPADCQTLSSPPVLDADNYECNGGLCEWQGCNSTEECVATSGNQDMVCE